MTSQLRRQPRRLCAPTTRASSGSTTTRCGRILQTRSSRTALKGYASDLGLDTTAFNDCLDSDKYLSQVQKDAQDAQSYGVTGTPGFFVNGRQVIGAIPFEDYQDSSGVTRPGFKSIIDAALQEAQGS
jgi:hypothetical protein